ncbi:MAG: protein kinase [Anaerolineae bacterium]
MNNILPAGTTLKSNSYRIQRLLGRGGFGVVYLADDLIMNQPCAIKESFDNSPGAQAQFEVEARILAHLSHPHLPRVTDNFIEPATGLQYLVMEYVEGKDLGELLDRTGPLPEGRVLAWMDQVLKAVAYLHNYKPRPVIHRDIKPDNIRLLPDGKTVKLVDFGISKIGGVSDPTRKAARGVAPGFSPPEQFGAGTDTYSDVYALGATLYNLLTNVIPPESIDIAHSGAKLVLPRHLNPRISPRVEQVILTAMQIDPKLRFPNAGEMHLALQGKRPTTVSAACPHCGAAVRATAKFCPDCGGTIPPVPFVFRPSGYQAKSIKDLVGGCDRYWDEGRDYFWRGEFEPWLASLGKQGQTLAAKARAIRARHTDKSAALEEFLEAADPTRSLPILTLDQTALDFGPLRKGDSKVLSFAISNSGRGYLHGTLDAKPPRWLSVRPAGFGCLSGAQQKIDVEVKTASLSGTELGVDYSGTVTVLSNRGQQAVHVRLKVVDEPQAQLDPLQVDLGRVAWGARLRGQVTVSNSGGGTLHGVLVASKPWIAVDQKSQPFALGKGQSLAIAFTVNAAGFARRGRYSSQLQVQAKGRGNPVAVVTVQVDVPFPLDPANPTSQVSTLKELRDFCDRDWQAGMTLLSNGRIGTFLRFIGKTEAARIADQCRQMPDKAIGLERLLRDGLGAKAPTRYDTNAMDVVSDLGLGPLPKFFGRPEVVTLQVLNKSKRGYLYGRVESLVDWLHIPQPRFGCLPGQVAEVKIHVDKKSRKIGLLSLGTELFEIVVE